MDWANSIGSPETERHSCCPSCGVALPLCAPRRDGPVLQWTCTICSRVISAALNPDYQLDQLRNIRLAPIPFDRSALQPVPELLDYVRTRAPIPTNSVEKRAAPRYFGCTAVPVLPLSAQLTPVGQPVLAASRNVSTRGVGLVHMMPITDPFMALELTTREGPIQLLVRVVRCRPLGPYFDLAGEFISKMADPESRLAGMPAADSALLSPPPVLNDQTAG